MLKSKHAKFSGVPVKCKWVCAYKFFDEIFKDKKDNNYFKYSVIKLL